MPTTYDAYPTATEVLALLTGVGISTTLDATALAPFIQGAIDAWEEDTGYLPFLEGESADFYYDPPGPNRRGESRGGGRQLCLDRGFTRIDQIHVGITTTDLTGQLLTLDSDYRFIPYNALAQLRPITRIEFTYPQWGAPRSIKVTGNPGYSAALKAEVWQAIREDAAGRVCEGLREGRGGRAVEWTDGEGVHERKSIELLEQWGSTWRRRSLDVRRHYTLLS